MVRPSPPAGAQRNEHERSLYDVEVPTINYHLKKVFEDKEFTIKGFAMDDERPKRGGSVLSDRYFEDALGAARPAPACDRPLRSVGSGLRVRRGSRGSGSGNHGLEAARALLRVLSAREPKCGAGDGWFGADWCASVEAMPTLPPDVLAALTRFRSALDERFGERVREVRLFGSHARGDANEDSDVDVFVTIEGLTGAERSDVLTLAYYADLAGEEDVLLSPLAYSTEQAAELRRRERRLLMDIDREGVAL